VWGCPKIVGGPVGQAVNGLTDAIDRVCPRIVGGPMGQAVNGLAEVTKGAGSARSLL